MSDITLVSACNRFRDNGSPADYLEKLTHTVPTWRMKAPLMPIIIFQHGWRNRTNVFDDIKKNSNISIIKYDCKGAETMRERMLSAHIFGVAKHVETPFHLKLDSVTFATNAEDWLDVRWIADQCDYALIAQPWGYTKPASMIPRIDHWMNGLAVANKIPKRDNFTTPEDTDHIQAEIKKLDKQRKKLVKGTPERQAPWDERMDLEMKIKPYETWKDAKKIEFTRWYVRRYYHMHGDTDNPARMKHKSNRICSWICLARTSMVQDIVNNLPLGRLPVPSHDSLLWRWADNLGLRINRVNFKALGFNHAKRGYREHCRMALEGK